jgi:hypothetical protein
VTLGRLVTLAIVLVAGVWLFRHSGLLTKGPTPESPSAPVDRAREAARDASGRASQATGAQAAADAPTGGGAVQENMTPDQVRALLGPPDEVTSETTEMGGARERWTYRSVGKSVVFENGIVVRVE